MKVSFGTRLEPDLRQRLKIYAAATDRTIEDVVAEALDGYLPPDDVTAEGNTSQSAGVMPRENALVTGQPWWPQGHNETAPAL